MSYYGKIDVRGPNLADNYEVLSKMDDGSVVSQAASKHKFEVICSVSTPFFKNKSLKQTQKNIC